MAQSLKFPREELTHDGLNLLMFFSADRIVTSVSFVSFLNMLSGILEMLSTVSVYPSVIPLNTSPHKPFLVPAVRPLGMVTATMPIPLPLKAVPSVKITFPVPSNAISIMPPSLLIAPLPTTSVSSFRKVTEVIVMPSGG